MPEGKKKSRSSRRVFVRTPGKKTVLTYRPRKPKKAHCASCGAVLKGMPRDTPSKIKKLPKSKRVPERPYAGQLCSRCMRMKIKSQIKRD